jgi:hypothetical protein
MNKPSMTKYYNLDGNLIFESPEGNGWIEWEETDDHLLQCLIGDIKVDRNIDVTILNQTRNRCGESKFTNLAETREYLKTLPQWDKTRYFSKITDLGSRGLMDCKTGDVIDPGFEYDLQPHLVIKYNNIVKKEKCAICGEKMLKRIPLDLFLFDYSASSVFRPVCDLCGKKYAPVLVNILANFYMGKNASTQFKIQE